MKKVLITGVMILVLATAAWAARYTEQDVLNNVYQNSATSLQIAPATVAMKITTSGTTTYIAIAPVGTLQSAAKWQVKRIAVSGSDTTITWAGGGAFNQVATDLSSLSYS